MIVQQDVNDFLQVCLQTEWDTNMVSVARTFAQRDDVDWQMVSEVAAANRIAPLLYYTLREKDVLPSKVEHAFRKAYLRTAERNMFLFDALGIALQQLQQANIPAIVLKGAALAQTIYPNVAVRPMLDLDILIPRQSAAATIQLLGGIGYTALTRETQPGVQIAFESESLLSKPGIIPSRIEVHWSLLDSPYYRTAIEMDWFWQTAIPLRVGAAQSLMLGPTAQLLHLCAHVRLHHRGEELLWLNDIAKLLHSSHLLIDWQEFVRRARAYNLILSVREILLRVQGWNVPVPNKVLDQLAALPVTPRESQVFGWLTANRPPPGKRLWTDLSSMSNWQVRIKFAYASLFPSSGYMQDRYHISHPILVVLAYPFRWLLGLRDLVHTRIVG